MGHVSFSRRIVFLVGICVLFLVPHSLFAAETEAEMREALERELAAMEVLIAKQQLLVDGKQTERKSLERDLSLIDAQIKKAQLGIDARRLAISKISGQIVEKEGVISELDQKLNRQKDSLGALLRRTQQIDDFSLAEVVLANTNLSKFLEDLDSFDAIKEELQKSFVEIRETKGITLDEKTSLEEKQIQEAEFKRLQELEKQQIEAHENEKEKILTVTKGQEAAYQAMLAQQQKTAAELRARLFQLLGGGGAIPFPDAVALAKVAGARTGVSTSLILAILEQESAYGKHIGSCVATDVVSGSAVMHPSRDLPVFQAMAKELGFDPARQQISCPWIDNGTRRGYGGAMGPSQFIPSTWATYGGFVFVNGAWSYDKSRDVIRGLTGKDSPSSPFNNQDAFIATALLMRDNGANGGTYAAERLAALRYFAGWGGASNPVNAPYGDGVMTRKARLEQEIKTLESS